MTDRPALACTNVSGQFYSGSGANAGAPTVRPATALTRQRRRDPAEPRRYRAPIRRLHRRRVGSVERAQTSCARPTCPRRVQPQPVDRGHSRQRALTVTAAVWWDGVRFTGWSKLKSHLVTRGVEPNGFLDGSPVDRLAPVAVIRPLGREEVLPPRHPRALAARARARLPQLGAPTHPGRGQPDATDRRRSADRLVEVGPPPGSRDAQLRRRGPGGSGPAPLSRRAPRAGSRATAPASCGLLRRTDRRRRAYSPARSAITPSNSGASGFQRFHCPAEPSFRTAETGIADADRLRLADAVVRDPRRDEGREHAEEDDRAADQRGQSRRSRAPAAESRAGDEEHRGDEHRERPGPVDGGLHDEREERADRGRRKRAGAALRAIPTATAPIPSDEQPEPHHPELGEQLEEDAVRLEDVELVEVALGAPRRSGTCPGPDRRPAGRAPSTRRHARHRAGR